MSDEVPSVAIGAGEAAPWEGLPLACPRCGAECELQDSEPPGLTYIAHCGEAWLRGRADLDRLFG